MSQPLTQPSSIQLPPMLYLASRSPRRAELLQQMGITFKVVPADVDESVLAGESAVDYVQRLARHKAEVCYSRLAEQGLHAMPVLAADTTVAVDDDILGKPEEGDQGYQAGAERMLGRLVGGWHEVHTAVAVASQHGVELVLSSTRVEMAALNQMTLRAYIASDEPRGKAGAYGIQGLASTFIRRIEGSYSGVMGLPVFETAELLNRVGIRVL